MQLLKITPEKYIEFPQIYFQAVTQILKLENLSDKKVAFKIKTTAPNNYLVRPSFGLIKVGEYVDIQIILQPLSDKENISADKFQVQCLNIDDDVVVDKSFWTKINKSNVQDHKLAVALINDANEHNNIRSNDIPLMSMNNESKNAQMGGYENIISNADENVKENELKGMPGMQRKYHELLNYCVFVDKQKAALEKENESLKNQLKALNSNSNKFMLECKFLPLIIIVLAIAAKYLGYW